MKKRIVAAGLGLAFAATTMGQSYNFPSPWNPAGKDASEMTQLIIFTWDDNGYSGMTGTQYEACDPACVKELEWNQHNTVGGNKNDFNIFETYTANPGRLEKDGTRQTMGIQWATEALALGKATNNRKVPMVFNMITGLFVDRESGTWDNSQSILGSYKPAPADSAPHIAIGVTWGREMAYDGNQNQITRAVNNLINAGSEIGNHTIDHMESNSPLVGGAPGGTTLAAQFQGSRGVGRTFSAGGKTWRQGFENWENEGFAVDNANMSSWGVSFDEAREFGQAVGNSAQSRGWLMYGGQQISQGAWEKYIEFSEVFLRFTGTGWTAPAGLTKGDPNNIVGMTSRSIAGFRAPRLEVNSALYYALKAQNYLYDCGLEEGYEWHRVGPNFMWPYSMDNGVQNSWTQFSSGNRVHTDSTPQGFWQIPSTPVIVPVEIREDVWRNHEEVMRGAGTPDGVDAKSRDHWIRHGKVTGFDFNTWILYGMTNENWQKTMRHTLDLRLSGNRAPMQFGMHTDYYTPMYDWATLRTNFNKDGWGLSAVKGWNTWITRQRETESFVNYALDKGAEFVTGVELIKRVDGWRKEGQGRATGKLPANVLNDWTWSDMDTSDNTENTTSKSFDNLSGTARISRTADVSKHGRFFVDFPAGTLQNATHIELDYKQTSASMIRLMMEDGTAREVMLAHRYPIFSNHQAYNTDNGNYGRAQPRPSGMIPISAFDYPTGTDYPMDYKPVDVAKVTGIEIQPLAPYAKPMEFGGKGWSNQPRTEPWEVRFEFKNFTIHTGRPFDYGAIEKPAEPNEQVSIAKVRANARNLSIAGVTSNALKLNIAQSGLYNVKIFSANGRLLQSFDAASLTAGVNTLRLNNFASGVYMIKVQGINTKQQLTKSALIM